MPDLAQILGGNAPLPGANSAVSTLQDLIAHLQRQQAQATFPETHGIQSGGGSPAGGGGNDLGKLLSGLGGKSGGRKPQGTGGGIGSMFQQMFGQNGNDGFDTGGSMLDGSLPASSGWDQDGYSGGVTNFGFDSMPDTGWWT